MSTFKNEGDTAPDTKEEQPSTSKVDTMIKKFSHKHEEKKSLSFPAFTKRTNMIRKPYENNLKQENLTIKNIDLTTDIDYTLGLNKNIEVQPDLRYPLLYIIHSVKRIYPLLFIEQVPKFSIMQLIAISQTLFVAHILHTDLLTHPSLTDSASSFKDTGHLKVQLNKLLNCPVPKFLETLLLRFTAMTENIMTNTLFIPSFSAASFIHDYGRLVPPSIFLAMHNALCAMDEDDTLNDVLFYFNCTDIVNYDNTMYNVANMIGSIYQFGEQTREHRNWLNMQYTQLLTDAYNTTIPQNRVGSIIRTNVPTYQPANFNAYTLLLGVDSITDTWIDQLLPALNDVYLTNPQIKGRTILELIQSASTNSSVVHAITEKTMPTWHDDHTTLPDATPTSVLTRQTQDYVTDMNLFTYILANEREVPYTLPKAKISSHILLYTPKDSQARKTPSTSSLDPNAKGERFQPTHLTRAQILPNFQSYNQNDDENKPVLIMNPYDEPLYTATVSITLGLRIENAELDAISMPLIHTLESVEVTNSQYDAGIIPITSTKPVLPSQQVTIPDIAMARPTHTERTHGIIIGDMSVNLTPRIQPNTPTEQNYNITDARTITKGFTNPNYASNIFTSNLDNYSKIPRERLDLWSSYRTIETSGANIDTIFLYPSLRPFFGTTIPYIKTKLLENQMNV